MSELLDSLFQLDQPKQFAKRFKEIEKELGEPTAFLEHLTQHLSKRYYEHHYELSVPHGWFGLAAAATIQPLFPEERRTWPILQHVWSMSHEPQRPAYQLDEKQTPSEDAAGPLLSRFHESAQKRDFDGAYAAAVLLCRNVETRSIFRSQSMDLAVQDLAQGGLKPLYLDQSWRLAESLNWVRTENILFPALHLLVTGPTDTGVAPFAQKAEAALSRIGQNNGGLDDSLYLKVEETLLFSNHANAPIHALEALADAGVGPEAAWDALALSAAQCLTNSKSGLWKDAAKALLFVYSRSSKPHEAGSPELLPAAWLLHKASASSRETGGNRKMVDLTIKLDGEDIFTMVRELVSYSDPYAAVDAAHGILKLGKADELFQNLATLAAKNDGRIGKGYDLLVVEACAALYGSSKISIKKKFPTACAFFLGRILKNYDLVAAYGV